MAYIIKPFAWLILAFYEMSGSYALALVLFSLVIKLVLFPFFMKGKKGMMKMSRLTPKVKELEKKYEGNKQKYSVEVQKLYKEENVSPLSGCIWNLIPFPFLLILYSVIRHPLSKIMNLSAEAIAKIGTILTGLGITPADTTTAYGEMTLAQQAAEQYTHIAAAVPGFVNLNMNFLGVNLAATPKFLFFMQSDAWHWATVGLWLIPIVSGLFALAQMLISQKMNPPMQTAGQSNLTMILMMPLVSVWIGFAMPASMSIYWIANSFFAIIQDWIATKYYKKRFDAEDAVKNAERVRREAELEEKRRLTEERKALDAQKADGNTSKKKLQKLEREEREKAEREYKERTGQLQKKDEARPFSRGRAYDPGRYANAAAPADEAAPEAPAEPESAGAQGEVDEYEDDNK